MRNKTLKFTTVSATMILIIAIIITSLACLQGVSDKFDKPNTDNVAIDTRYVRSGSVDGQMIGNKIDFVDNIHTKIEDEASLLNFLDPSIKTTKSIGLVTTDFSITNNPNINKVLQQGKTLDGNGYVITINQNGSHSSTSDKTVIDEYNHIPLGYRYTYYGGLVGANFGTVQNINIDYAGTSVINQDIGTLEVVEGTYADGFATGIVTGINFGTVLNVKATVGTRMGFSATNTDIYSGILAGVNYGIISKSTAVLNSNYIVKATDINKTNLTAGLVGLMITNINFGFKSLMGDVSFVGEENTGNIEIGASNRAAVASIFALNSNHHLSADNPLKAEYSPGVIDGVIHDYYGKITKNGTLIQNYLVGECGVAANVFYTNPNVDVYYSYVSCATSKIFPSLVKTDLKAVYNNTPEVRLAFDRSSNGLSNSVFLNITSSVKNKDDKSLIVFDITKDRRKVNLDGDAIDKNENSTITQFEFNNENKVATNHIDFTVSVSGSVMSGEVIKEFSTFNIRYGGLGSVKLELDTNKSYTGKTKTNIQMYNEKNLPYNISNHSEIKVSARIQGTENFHDMINPTTYDQVKTEMLNVYDATGAMVHNNKGVTYVDKGARLIIPLTVFNLKELYKIEPANAKMNVFNKNGQNIIPNEFKPLNYMKVSFNIVNAGSDAAISDVYYKTSTGKSGFFSDLNPLDPTNMILNSGDFGRKGNTFTFIGYKDGMVVTKPISINLYLDAEAPELNVDFDDMTEWSGKNSIVITGNVFDYNTISPILEFKDGATETNVVVDANGNFSIVIDKSGGRQITISARDNAGNITSINKHIMLDNTQVDFNIKATSSSNNYTAGSTAIDSIFFKATITSSSMSEVLMYIQIDNGILIPITSTTNVYTYKLNYTPEKGSNIKFTSINGAGKENVVVFGTAIISINDQNIISIKTTDLSYDPIDKVYDGTTSVPDSINIIFKDHLINAVIIAKYKDVNVSESVGIDLAIESFDEGKHYVFIGDLRGKITKATVNISINDVRVRYGDVNTNYNIRAIDTTSGNLVVDDFFKQLDITVRTAEDNMDVDIKNLDVGVYRLRAQFDNSTLQNYFVNRSEAGTYIVIPRNVKVQTDDDAFYNKTYTGAPLVYNPYFVNTSNQKVYLDLAYGKIEGTVVTPIDNPGDAGMYKYTIMIKPSETNLDSKNYTLDGADKAGIVSGSLEIFKFKPFFLVENIKDKVLNVNYNGKAQPIIYLDGSEVLGVEALAYYMSKFTITYNGIADIPTQSGAYNVVMNFTGGDDSKNYANQQKVFVMNILKQKVTYTFADVKVDFNDKDTSLVIGNIPAEFGVINQLGIDKNPKIMYYTNVEYAEAIASGAVFDPSILHIILTRFDISPEDEINEGATAAELSKKYIYRNAGTYKFEINMINFNYDFITANKRATLTINKVLVDKLVTFANKIVNYNGDEHKINDLIYNDSHVTVTTNENNPTVAINVGTYTYKFTVESKNLTHGSKQITVLLIINAISMNKDDILIKSQTKVFDGNEFVITADKLPDGATLTPSPENSSNYNVGTNNLLFVVSKPNYIDFKITVKCYVTPLGVDVVFKDLTTIEGSPVKVTGIFIDVNGFEQEVEIDISAASKLLPGVYACDVNIDDYNYVLNDGFETVNITINPKPNYLLMGIGAAGGACVIIGGVVVTLLIIRKRKNKISL